MKFPKEALFNKTFFRRFLIPYLFILLLPLLLASFAYNEAVQIVEREARQSKLTVLEQTRDILDRALNDLDETFIQLSLDVKLSRLMRIEAAFGNSPLWYDVWDYLNEIRSRAVVTGSSLQSSSFYIAIKGSDLVFTSDQTVNATQQFYEDAFRYDGVSYGEWHGQLFDRRYMKTVFPARKAFANGEERTVIAYTSSLPIQPADTSLGVVSFLIDVKDINRLIGSKGSDSDRFAIIDGSGRFIMGGDSGYFGKGAIPGLDQGPHEGHSILKRNGENVMYVYARSTYNDWTYVSALPLEEVMGDVIRIRNIAVAVAALSLLVGLLFSVLFAYRSSKPFREMLGTLKDFWTRTREDESPAARGEADDFSYLRGSINHLITDHQHLQSTLEFKNAALRTVFFDRLLKGEFGDRAGMEELQSYVGLSISGEAFAVVLLRRYRHPASLHPAVLEELDVLREYAGAVIEQAFPGRSFVHIANENELAVLLSSEDKDPAAFAGKIGGLLERLLADIRERGGAAPLIGVGGTYALLTDASYSFQEARQALGRQLSEEPSTEPVVWYADIKKEYTAYYYPTEIEIKLMNLVKAGTVEETRRLVEHIRHENESVRVLTPDMMQSLLNDMHSTLHKLRDQIKAEPDKDEPLAMQSPAGLKGMDEVAARFELLCRLVEAGKKSRNTRLAQAICDYLGDTFTDPGLSLAEAASRFNMSESYLSQFFREQTGETFSTYVETLRIGLARQLILEGRDSIDEIAQKAGYNSTHSFRRAFKRVMGIVPSAYKQTGEPQ
ncbi:helix-turn-helix domain-containing protein [Paenibacillus hodogayensis]|uniref:Helix-turn-helix domain-containing protein n=1 Tax=Paenibacillus hodogayensis TaxID=279208 RepID=A0ABV5VR75_9BACL